MFPHSVNNTPKIPTLRETGTQKGKLQIVKIMSLPRIKWYQAEIRQARPRQSKGCFYVLILRMPSDFYVLLKVINTHKIAS
jgi:hypothetical protein